MRRWIPHSPVFSSFLPPLLILPYLLAAGFWSAPELLLSFIYMLPPVELSLVAVSTIHIPMTPNLQLQSEPFLWIPNADQQIHLEGISNEMTKIDFRSPSICPKPHTCPFLVFPIRYNSNPILSVNNQNSRDHPWCPSFFHTLHKYVSEFFWLYLQNVSRIWLLITQPTTQLSVPKMIAITS